MLKIVEIFSEFGWIGTIFLVESLVWVCCGLNIFEMVLLKKTASSFSLAVFFKQDLYVFYDGIHKMILTDKILEGTIIAFMIELFC